MQVPFRERMMLLLYVRVSENHPQFRLHLEQCSFWVDKNLKNEEEPTHAQTS